MMSNFLLKLGISDIATRLWILFKPFSLTSSGTDSSREVTAGGVEVLIPHRPSLNTPGVLPMPARQGGALTNAFWLGEAGRLIAAPIPSTSMMEGALLH